MIFPLHITVGEIRKLIAEMPDAAPLCMRYGDVCDDYVFTRVDGLTAETPGTIPCMDGDREWDEHYPFPCPVLTISLVDGEAGS